MEKMLQEAQRVFGEKFRAPAKLKKHQEETLQYLASGADVFSALPTGYGKSLCYWLPAAAWHWRVLVVCPLISLIEDQKRALDTLQMKTVYFHSGLSGEARNKNQLLFDSGDWQICLISPERLARWRDSPDFITIQKFGIDLLVLDEMHCLEDWREFREGYSNIYEPIKRLLGSGVQLLGLSASMPAIESEAWMEELCEAPKFVRSSLGRENIEIAVIALDEENSRWLILLNALKNLEANDSALIYCSTRAEADSLSSWLNSAGLSSAVYHAGIPSVIRTSRLRNFTQGNISIMCCTSAFGMGVDYANVRWVIHFSLPYSLSSYWQEIGRAGRNGKTAYAICLWRRSEILRARGMSAAQKKAYSELWLGFSSEICRKKTVASSLGILQEPCGKCDQCVKNGQGVFSSHLQEMDFFFRKKKWWLESAAEIHTWICEKIFVD